MESSRKIGQPTVCCSCAIVAAEMPQIAQQLTEVGQSIEERISRLFKRIEKCEQLAKDLGLYENKVAVEAKAAVDTQSATDA